MHRREGKPVRAVSGKYNKRNSRADTIPLQSFKKLPEPDYGESVKPSSSGVAMADPVGNEGLGVSEKPDYGESVKPSRSKGGAFVDLINNEALGVSAKPDYGESVKPTRSKGGAMAGPVSNKGLGVSTKPDYDSDPEEDYGKTVGPSKSFNIPEHSTQITAPKTKFKPVGGVQMFPSATKDKNHVKQPNFRASPTKSSLKVRKKDPDAKEKDPLLLQDLSKLPELSLDTISDCIETRFQKDLIYTNCGEILISVNPFKDVELCSHKYFSEYSDTHVSETSHLFSVSAKAYQNVLARGVNQVILVSGESGAGKTEATKLLVRHLMSIGGSEYPSLQDRIIEINPLLEAFGNAKTILNNNSSRFAKFLSLTINKSGKIESARVKDYMLEKSRVLHQEAGERNFHAFYSFLTGASDDTLDAVFLSRSHQFRILGKLSSLSAKEKQQYQKIYNEQQTAFQLIKLNEEEIQDINIILATVLHLGDIEFEESDNDCVVIKDEVVVHNVATLLQLDVTEITKIFLERSAKLGKTEDTIVMSKNKKQAEDERDATAKALYERMFGWLVRKINDALKADKFKNLASIGILDICGFENLAVNSLEQLCINLVNEQLQNFMNKMVIEDERQMYLKEGVEITDVDIEDINNDAVLEMFMQKRIGVLDLIDEDTKSGLSTDERLVLKLSNKYGGGGILVPHSAEDPGFSIKHFAGKVAYSARSFLKKNRDTLSKDMVNCLKSSQSTLIQDLFTVPETRTGSISMANFIFRGSRKPSTKFRRPVSDGSLSESINTRRKVSFKNVLGNNRPTLQSGDFANQSTHIKFFRKSLEDLQLAMKEANPFFVRCIKPNDKQVAGTFLRDRVKTQLQYTGVKEVARIRTCGFPFRYLKEDFKNSYLKIAVPGYDTIQNIFLAVEADRSQYKIGSHQVFLKESVKKELDDALSELKRKEEEEKRRQEEEKKRQEELKRKLEEEKRHRAEFENNIDLTMLKLPTSLDTITEVPTPCSYVDDPVYNKPMGSNSSKNTTLLTTEDESEDDSEVVAPNVEEIPDEDKLAAAWDITQEITEEEERLDVHEQPILMALKFFVYILLFVIILGTLVIEKCSFLLLVTELAPIADRKDIKQKDIQTVSYILLVIAICVPYALGWLITVAKLCFGNFKRPSVATWIWVFIMENLHAVGLCLLVFRIMRHLDVIRAAMLLSGTAIIPAILKITMSSSDFNTEGGPCVRCEPQGGARQVLRNILDVVALLVQMSVIPLIIILDYFKNANSVLSEPWNVVEIVASFILISFSHWENFTDGRLFCLLGERNWFKDAVLKIRYDLQMGRHYPFLITFLWKIGLTVLLAYLLSGDISLNYLEAFTKLGKKNLELKAVSAVIALTIAAFVGFYASFGACMFQMQIISLTIPACLATPATIGIFYLNCQYDFLKTVTNTNAQCPANLIQDQWYHFLFGAAWWLSLLLVTRHMWRPQVDRTANMARVFLTPIYCGILTTEFIMMNRRRNPCKVFEDPEINDQGEITIAHYKLRRYNKMSEDDDDGEKGETSDLNEEEEKRNPLTPKLYACATMWHETRTEMVQLLKSLYRLDRDQYIRRITNEKIQGYDPEFYNFEAHIFFDDAMEPDDNDEQIPNRWVKELVSCMDIACSSVHEKPMRVFPPTKMPTPYGGQLIWEMPGENYLFVHMKDIKKIRNRKRWSQVMYMYYLLGYKHIMANKHDLLEKLKQVNLKQGNHGLNINQINYLLGEKSALQAQNTFILALDGDTDFSPGSIKILMDRMKDENVGAACGRIHPIGNGPMVWYQKFEYAIGHWLQKSAEHVLGCVLCSPGCFSLFRASALMDTNVMKKYTTEPTEPGHHLQYDQGEDRWLCTLMLQQGYRIEYAAAADAWTFAPEGFFEFFNQRRRWMPSTIANILDLLGSATMTTKRNANMSLIYILYQWLLMLMTVLGPGTIIMMIAGAVKLVFKFTLVEAYLFATIPAGVFTFICFWFSSRIQLIIAAMLSVVYTFIMMIVLVGTIVTATQENIFYPSVLVIVVLVSIFIVAGLCHPQEIFCLIHGVIYLLTIPSGYLLLVIYSICNLNDVSWGTREVPTKAQRIEMEKKKKEKEEQKKNKPKKGFMAKLFNRGEEHIRELTKLVKTLVPQKPAGPQQLLGLPPVADLEAGGQADNQVIQILSKIEFNLEQLLKKTGTGTNEGCLLNSVVVNQPGTKQPTSQQTAASAVDAKSSGKSQPTEEARKILAASKKSAKKMKPKKVRDELINPVWMEDKDLGNGYKIRGNKDEIQFWSEFVTKYLLPIRPTPEEKKKIADGLRDLRNSSSFALIIVNLLWMALNFMFQYTNAARFAIGYAYGGNKYKIEESVLGMGFVFLLLFLLIIQMIGMLFHRMGTLQHLLAITEIKICKTKMDSSYSDHRNREDVIRRINKVFKIPMTGDAGITTKPAVPTKDGNNWGVTFVPKSSRGILTNDDGDTGLLQSLGQTLRNPILNRRQNSFSDSQNKNLTSVTQRLVGGNVKHRLQNNSALGMTILPNLPPRGRSFHQPFVSQARNLGFTYKELQNANISIEKDDEPARYKHLGPMGRTLFQKSKIINDETQRNDNDAQRSNIRWNHNDVFRDQRPSFSGPASRYT